MAYTLQQGLTGATVFVVQLFMIFTRFRILYVLGLVCGVFDGCGVCPTIYWMFRFQKCLQREHLNNEFPVHKVVMSTVLMVLTVLIISIAPVVALHTSSVQRDRRRFYRLGLNTMNKFVIQKRQG